VCGYAFVRVCIPVAVVGDLNDPRIYAVDNGFGREFLCEELYIYIFFVCGITGDGAFGFGCVVYPWLCMCVSVVVLYVRDCMGVRH
jgi:hypothetical protein